VKNTLTNFLLLKTVLSSTVMRGIKAATIL